MQNRFLLLSERNKREILDSLPDDGDILKLADYFQNFSDSTRIKILTCLSMSNMCVNDLSSLLGINQTTISHQLKQLKDQNIVSYRREGKILVYYLLNDNVNDMMMRKIKTLNNMSFRLPNKWKPTTDRYNLMNGQGFVNTENYLSENGKVISLFEIYRNPEEFFENYQQLLENYDEKRDGIVFEREFLLKFGEYNFPVFILKGVKQPILYIVQVFVNCGDKLGCFIINLDNYYDDNKQIINNNQTFYALAEILRSIQ